MAEEKPKIESLGMSRDDWSALRHVLHNVRGSSPSSMSPIYIEELPEDIL